MIEIGLPPVKRFQVRKQEDQTIDWGVRLMGVPDIWRLTQGEGAVVALLDTGIWTRHKDLQESLIRENKRVVGFNCTSGKRGSFQDGEGHGTHCAGIVAANRNVFGITGVAPQAKLIPVKVLDDQGSGNLEWLLAGFDWVLENHRKYGIKILSMSLGSPSSLPGIEDKLLEIKKAGLMTICAAGNEGNQKNLNYPGRYAEKQLCLAVGAVQSDKTIADFSNTGTGMTRMGVVAPGWQVLSTIPRNRYQRMSGTSMAVPHIAGILALAVSRHIQIPGETPLNSLAEAFEHLRRFTEDLGRKGSDKTYGIGLPFLKEEIFKTLQLGRF